MASQQGGPISWAVPGSSALPTSQVIQYCPGQIHHNSASQSDQAFLNSSFSARLPGPVLVLLANRFDSNSNCPALLCPALLFTAPEECPPPCQSYPQPPHPGFKAPLSASSLTPCPQAPGPRHSHCSLSCHQAHAQDVHLVVTCYPPSAATLSPS